MKSKLEEEMAFHLKLLGLKDSYQREYKFCPDRKWRFDFALVKQKIAIEVEGGIFIPGGHSTGKGIMRDMEKYNWATVNGWKVLRYTNGTIPNVINDLKQLCVGAKSTLKTLRKPGVIKSKRKKRGANSVG